MITTIFNTIIPLDKNSDFLKYFPYIVYLDSENYTIDYLHNQLGVGNHINILSNFSFLWYKFGLSNIDISSDIIFIFK